MTPVEIREKFSLRNPEVIQVLQFFADSYLQFQLRDVALSVQRLAFKLVEETSDSPELIIALRELLGAKESFFRHYLIVNNFYIVRDKNGT